jgi:hypothetical protein
MGRWFRNRGLGIKGFGFLKKGFKQKHSNFIFEFQQTKAMHQHVCNN